MYTSYIFKKLLINFNIFLKMELKNNNYEASWFLV